jgi:hypothetical protein
MTDSSELSKKRAKAGRKGGHARVKKGMGVNKKLASEAGKKGAKKRWSNRDENN